MARNSQARKAKKNTVHDEYYIDMENAKAILEGPKKKKWTFHDIKSIKPITEAQRQLFESYYYGNHIVANGSAGTGKTFCALYLGLSDVLSETTDKEKIIIIRSAVQSREIGFTPGTVLEKMEPYEAPYTDILYDLFGKKSTYRDMKDAGLVEFMPTSFLRGTSFDNAVIIIDEIQNLNMSEIFTVLTRCGKNTTVICIGDTVQTDLNHNKNDVSGLPTLLKIVQKMPEFSTITFTNNDIVRSKFVKSFINAYEEIVGSYSPSS